MRDRVAVLALVALGAAAAPVRAASLVFPDDPALAVGRATLLLAQDARGLGMYPLSDRELRARGVLTAPPDPTGARLHLVWRPQASAWRGLSPALREGTLWYDAIAPLAELGANVSDGEWLGAHLRLDLSSVRRDFTGDGLAAPWTLDSYANLDFPRESWAVVATEHLLVAAGRFRSGIGHGVFGNPFLNGRAPWYDQVQAEWHDDHFRARWLLGTSSSFLTAAEAAVQGYGTAAPPRGGFDPVNNYDSARFDAPAKSFMYRWYEWAPWPWLVLGAGEMGVVGGKQPDLSQLLPMVVWHNAYAPGSTNVMLGVSAAVAPLPGLLLFGELVADDVATRNEADGQKPTSLGWQLGGRWVASVHADVLAEVAVEYTHVDRWTYQRWQPYLVMQQRQIVPCGCNFVDVPLGYPWGGDLDAAGARLRAFAPDGLELSLGIEGMWRGAMRLGAITGSPLLDDQGAPVLDRFGEPVRAPLYYDLDAWAGPGALDEYTQRPREARVTISLGADIPIAPHVSANAMVLWSALDNVENAAGVRAQRWLLHGGMRVAL